MTASRLQEVVQPFVARPERPALGAEDADCHRALEPERTADRHYPLAYAQRVHVAQLQDDQILDFLRVHLEHSEVGGLVRTDDLGGQPLAVREHHLHFDRVLDDVVIRQQVAFLTEEHAGTLGDARRRLTEDVGLLDGGEHLHDSRHGLIHGVRDVVGRREHLGSTLLRVDSLFRGHRSEGGRRRFRCGRRRGCGGARTCGERGGGERRMEQHGQFAQAGPP